MNSNEKFFWEVADEYHDGEYFDVRARRFVGLTPDEMLENLLQMYPKGRPLFVSRGVKPLMCWDGKFQYRRDVVKDILRHVTVVVPKSLRTLVREEEEYDRAFKQDGWA